MSTVNEASFVLENITCVIPHYGDVAMTQACVAQCLEELAPPNLLVVDNGNDYVAVGDESVIRPGSNLGWLRGCNLGLRQSFSNGAAGVVLLNNDVTLSDRFFAGLAQAARATPAAGLIAPCYDGPFQSQNRFWTGPPAEFPAEPREQRANVVDGTAVLITKQCFVAVGEFDASLFGRHGWGAIVALCRDSYAAGFDVIVSRRSYLHHFMSVSATAASSRYLDDAALEMELGLRRRFGRNWREDHGYVSDGTGPRRRTRTLLLSSSLARGRLLQSQFAQKLSSGRRSISQGS